MSPLIRGGLFVAGFAGAVGLGYALKPIPQPTRAAAPPTIVLNVPEVPTPPSTAVPPPKMESRDELVVPPVSDRDVAAEPVNKNDIAFQVIAKELGIKTTLEDKPAGGPITPAGATSPPPLPSIPAPAPDSPAMLPVPGDAFKHPEVPAAQGVPRIEVTPPPPEPMPRLDAVPPPNPGLDIPRIPDAAPPLTIVPEAGSPKPPAKLILNTRAVVFNFEVTKVGPSKVKAVELWATRDGGKTWARYDRMVGDKSPFKTYLGGEGEFGFQLVVESESGRRTPEPSGPAKAVTVEIDMTPPRVSELKIYGGGPGEVRLSWQAEDKNLDDQKTRLEYSADGRTWRPISFAASRPHKAFVPAPPGVQSAGSVHYFFAWKMPDGLPHELQFRVTAVDRAGNEASATLPEHPSIDLVVPEGKLTGVEPQRTGETGPMPRVVADRQIFSFYTDFTQFRGQ